MKHNTFKKGTIYSSLAQPLTERHILESNRKETMTEKKGYMLNSWEEIVAHIKDKALNLRNPKLSFSHNLGRTSNSRIKRSLGQMVENKSLYTSLEADFEIHCSDIKENMIVLGGNEGTLLLYEFHNLNLKFLQELGDKNSIFPLNRKHDDFIDSVSFCSGDMIVSGSHDGTVKIWQHDEKHDSYQGVGVLDGHSGKVISLSITKDKELIVTASNDKSILIWKKVQNPSNETIQYEVIQKLQEMIYIEGITISKDKRFIACGLDDGDVNIYKHEGEKFTKYQVLREHQGEVNSVSFSSLKGGTLVTGSSDGSVRIWEMDSDENFFCVNVLNKPGTQVISVSVSSDGQYVVGGYNDKAVRIWKSDSDAGGVFKKHKSLKNHKSSLTSISISDDDKFILSCSTDKTMNLWRMEDNEVSGEHLQVLGDSKILGNCLCYSDDREMIFLGGNLYDDQKVTISHNYVMVWRSKMIDGVVAFQPYQKLKGHKGGILALSVSKDRRLLVSGSEDKTAILWTLTDQDEMLAGVGYEKLQTLEGHSGSVTAVELSNQGKHVFTGSTDKSIKVWRAKKGNYEVLSTLDGHDWRISCLKYSDQGNLLVSGSGGSEIKIWQLSNQSMNITDENQVFKLDEHENSIRDIQLFNNWKNMVSCSSDGKLILYEQKISGKNIKYKSVKTVDFLCSRIRVVEAYKIILAIDQASSLIHILDIKTLKKLGEVQGHGSTISTFDVSSSGTSLCSFSQKQSLKIWNFHNTDSSNPKIKLTQTIDSKAKYSKMNCVSYSSESGYIAVGMRDRTTRVYFKNDKGGYEDEQIIGDGCPISAVKLSKDGSYLLTGDISGRICLWSFDKKTKKFKFCKNLLLGKYQNASVNCLDISNPFQKVKMRFVTAGFTKDMILVWKCTNINGEAKFKPMNNGKLKGHQGAVYSVQICESVKNIGVPVIVSGSADKTIKVWKYIKKLGENEDIFILNQTIVSDFGYIYSVHLSFDNLYLVGGCEDKTTVVWKLNLKLNAYEKHQTIEETDTYSYIWTSKISKKKDMIASSRGDGKIRFWKKTAGYFKSYFDIDKGEFFDISDDFNSIVALKKGENVIKVRSLKADFDLPDSYFFLKKIEEIFSDPNIFMNKNGLYRMAKYLKYLKDHMTDTYDINFLIHSRINILLLAILSGYPDYVETCLTWFGYKPAFYKNKFDPLEVALKINSKVVLDKFTEFFEENYDNSNQWNPLFCDSKSLFYKILKCSSTQLKKYLIVNFLEEGKTSGISLPELVPISEEKKYIAIETPLFIRDQYFKDQLQKKTHKSFINRETEIRYKTSVFPVNLSVNSKFSTELLKFLSDSKDLIYDSDMKFLIREMWKKNVWIFWIYAILSWTTTILFTYGVIFDKHSSVIPILVTILCIINFIFEFKVAQANYKKYFSDFTNFVDIFLVFNLPVILFLSKSNDSFETKNLTNFYSSLFIILSAARSSMHLRVVDSFRYQVAMTIETFKKMQGFLILLVISILILTSVTIQVDKTAGKTTETFSHFLKEVNFMYNLFHGDWDGTDNTNELNANQYIQFLINTVFLPLVMLNFLISIIVNVYETYIEIKIYADYSESIELLVSMNYFASWGTRGEYEDGDADGGEKYFHLIVKDKEDFEVEKRLEGVERKLEKVLSKM